MGQLFSRKVEAADEASTIPTSGSCNRTVELGSSIQINPVDEIKDVVVVSEEALPREADHGLGQVGIVIGKEDFIERSMPLVCEKEGEIRRKGPYTSDQKILLVGEGDFSFSVCLAVAFGSATNMVATSLDSREFLCENYKRAMRNILELTNRGCAVMHEIDATKMAKKYSPLHGMQFDRIIFNFPHAGVFNNDESRGARLRKNQKLISMFLANAKMMIKNDGEIHIRHKFKGFFREWKIQQLGEHEGLRLIEAVPFYLKEYEGYSTKLGYGGNEYFNCYPSKTYKFGLTESARSMGESGRRAEQSSKLGSLLELGEEPFARVKSSGEGGQVGGVAVPRVAHPGEGKGDGVGFPKDPNPIHLGTEEALKQEANGQILPVCLAMGQLISTVLSFFKRVIRSRKSKAADEETPSKPGIGKEESYYVDIDSIDASSSSSQHNAQFKALREPLSSLPHHIHAIHFLEEDLSISESHETSNIPTCGSCNTSTADLVLGSSIVIDLVDDEDDRRRPEEIKDVVFVSEEALPREADALVEEVGIVLGKEDFTERPLPLALDSEKEVEITRKGPYTSVQKILLVGEGDFSFSVCLAVAFGSATNMVATSLDSREFLCENYKSAMRNILELTSRGCAVMHEIDATKMARKYSPLHGMQFDRILFNFPHAGVFNNDSSRGAQLRKNQKLISMFLANAKMMIKMDGEIHIRHKSKGFFREWKIQQLGEHEGLRLIEAVPFYLKEYEGYSTKLGYGGNEYFNCYPSKTYKFGLPC
ncbi:hypothetical protein Dimus_014430 [Dionaea muscipula]